MKSTTSGSGMNKHLVMGGAGFLGRHVVCQLASQDINVVVADRNALPTAVTDQYRVDSRIVDLINAPVDELRALIEGYDVLHHYVWTSLPASANAAPVTDLVDNVGFTLRLLDAARDSGARIIFCSSGGTVYGRATHFPIPEDADLNPLTAYGVSKVAAEKYCGYYRAVHGCDAVVARLANPYGAGQPKSRMQGVVSRSAHLYLDREQIEVWGDGSVVRDYLYVWDAAEALCAIALAERVTNDSLPIFNVGGGVGSSVNDVIAALRRQGDEPLRVVYRDQRNFDVKTNILDLSRAHDVLGWGPQTSLEEGVALLVSDLRRDRDVQLASRPARGG